MVLPTATPEKTAELTWEIAQLFPAQGHWSEEEYLSLDTNNLIEFSQGQLEVLPLPTFSHQRLVAFLYRLLLGFVEKRGLGVVMFAPLRIQLGQGKFREPDLVFMAAEHADRLGEQFWRGADLVMEVVSPNDPERDKVTKRREYAQSGIPEYWIVDPTDASITVLTLRGREYALHGAFVAGESASSVLLEGFRVDVSDLFSQASR
ncbi:MAG: Uma2 family endonuclease [Caldilineaceae bacterium]|nr:Uma2 family endonuclease [Caldilineaceae bacterium]